jgi:2-amino-4-hydroxy-6-hydroxymethyldihydropteridine diphosphokinase
MIASRPDASFPLPAWAQVTAARRSHIRRVARLLDDWARRLAVTAEERRRWIRAAILHDALKDAAPGEIERLAVPRVGPPAVWHGAAAARRAEQDGERDPGVLDAVRYHPVGYAGWDQVGRMLYLADYLEPGRRFDAERRRAWLARVPRDPDAVLRQVARARITSGLQHGWPMLAETVAFWNALV